jgi:ribonuclease III
MIAGKGGYDGMTEQLEPDDMTRILERCEASLDYRFQNRRLLSLCLTHASIARTRLESNERLEFLGDAIMGAVVCEQLFELYPDKAEGDLTRIKSVIVSRTTCAKISSDLGLHYDVQLGKGLSDPETLPPSIRAAVFESIVAGVYLDGGFDAARVLVRRLMAPEIERTVETSHGKNYKSLLQQHVQKGNRGTPCYLLLDEKGPDHLKCFLMAVRVGADSFAPAWGPNKKEAEQRAAENALCQLQGLEPPYAHAEPSPPTEATAEAIEPVSSEHIPSDDAQPSATSSTEPPVDSNGLSNEVATPTVTDSLSAICTEQPA